MGKRRLYTDRKLNEIIMNDVMNPLRLSESGEPLYLIHASQTTRKDADRVWDRDNYPFTTIEYMVSGAGQVEIDGEVYEVSAGDVYILPSRRHHLLRSSRDRPWIKRFVAFYGPLIEELLALYGLNGHFHFRDCAASGIPELLTELMEIFAAHAPDVHVAAAPVACGIVAHLSYLHRPAPRPLTPRIMEIKLYIDRHLYEPLAVGMLAERFGISIRHLIRVFRDNLGTTPYAYYMDKKIELAGELLRGSHATAAEIAFRLGFSDAYHFSKVFHRKTGLSPSRFRRGEPASNAAGTEPGAE